MSRKAHPAYDFYLRKAHDTMSRKAHPAYDFYLRKAHDTARPVLDAIGCGKTPHGSDMAALLGMMVSYADAPFDPRQPGEDELIARPIESWLWCHEPYPGPEAVAAVINRLHYHIQRQMGEGSQ